MPYYIIAPHYRRPLTQAQPTLVCGAGKGRAGKGSREHWAGLFFVQLLVFEFGGSGAYAGRYAAAECYCNTLYIL